MNNKKDIRDSIKHYPYSTNRHLVFDWASLAMHMLHAPENGTYIKDLSPLQMQCTSLSYNKDGYYVSYGNNEKVYHITKTDKLNREIIYELPSDVTLLSTDWHSKLSKDVIDYIMHIEAAEWQCNIWFSKMLGEVINIIKIFNPRDITIALEGKNTWRHDVYNEFYSRPGKITYQVCDNLYIMKYDLKEILLVTEGSDITNIVDKSRKANKAKGIINGKKEFESITSGKEFTSIDKNDLPKFIYDYCNDKLVPTYKGNRKSKDWEFAFTKSEWAFIRDESAKVISKYFRSFAINHDRCEGDDIVHLAIKKYIDNYDDTVLVTRDSDMNQLLHEEKLVIYNHHDRSIQDNLDSFAYLTCKILSGDTADNIPGMVLPNKSTKIAEKGAIALFESSDYNPYKKSVSEGWDDQYIRNKKLIDLTEVPIEISSEVYDLLSNREWLPSLSKFDYKVYDQYSESLNKMESMGYFSLNREDVTFKGKKYEDVILASQLNDPNNKSIIDNYNDVQNKTWESENIDNSQNEKWLTNGNADNSSYDGWENSDESWLTNVNPDTSSYDGWETQASQDIWNTSNDDNVGDVW